MGREKDSNATKGRGSRLKAKKKKKLWRNDLLSLAINNNFHLVTKCQLVPLQLLEYTGGIAYQCYFLLCANSSAQKSGALFLFLFYNKTEFSYLFSRLLPGGMLSSGLLSNPQIHGALQHQHSMARGGNSGSAGIFGQ